MKIIPLLIPLLLLARCPCHSVSPAGKRAGTLTVYVAVARTPERISERQIFDKQGHLVSEQHYDELGSVHSRNDYTYDAKGREVKDVYFLSDTVCSITTTLYNKLDSITAYCVYTPDHRPDFTIHVNYNQQGRNEEDVAVNSDGSVKFRDHYTLDTDGKWLKWERFSGDTIEHTVVYAYDRYNRKLSNICSGSLGGTYHFTYDQLGRKTRERAFNTADHSFLWLKIYRYDNTGRISKVIEYNDPNDRPESPAKAYRYVYR